MLNRSIKTGLSCILCLAIFTPMLPVFSHGYHTEDSYGISSISEDDIETLVIEDVNSPRSSSNWAPPMPLPNSVLSASQLAAWEQYYCTASGISDYERQMLMIINAERASRNIAPLEINYDLFRAARFKSQNMNDLDYFSHINPVYGAPWDITSLFTSANFTGENLAWHTRPTPENLMGILMASPVHRDNLLNPNHRTVGIGIFNQKATQTFSNTTASGTSCAIPDADQTAPDLPYSITTMRRPGITIRNTTLHTGPNSNYPAIGPINGSTNIRITGRTNGWYRVVVEREGGAVTGWLRQSNVAHTRVNAVVTTNNAHVRAGRSTSHESLTRIESGRRVTITRRTANWSRVSVDGHVGWIRNRDLSIDNGARPGRSITPHVTVHARPNSDSTVRHTIPMHTEFMIVQRTMNGWSQIRLRHQAGILHGWVRTDQIENRVQTRRTVNNAPLRSSPSSNGQRLNTIPVNSNVSVRARVGNWYYVRLTLNGTTQEGFLHRDRLTILQLP